MSNHQRFPSSVEVKEPHSVSLKVLRLARPTLVPQHPFRPPNPISSQPPSESSPRRDATAPASLAYAPARPALLNASSNDDDGDSSRNDTPSTNADPFVLSPILALPASFGSTYVGETFSCTLCANNEVLALAVAAANVGTIGGQMPLTVATLRATGGDGGGPPPTPTVKKKIRDVRIEAEMKTPNATVPTTLDLIGYIPPVDSSSSSSLEKGGDDGDDKDSSSVVGPDGEAKAKDKTITAAAATDGGVDLEPGETLQRVLQFHLKEKGNHVLAVTVSYYEATETSGRTRTFRKLYQFVCKPALVVRTKVSSLPSTTPPQRRRWVLEAQLENCSDETVQLDRVFLELEPGLVYEDLNWDAVARARGSSGSTSGDERASGLLRPLAHPGEVEQVCFVVSDEDEDGGASGGAADDGGDVDRQRRRAEETADGRVMFGIMGVGWRGEMGSVGFLSTGRLGSRSSTTAAQ